MSKMIDFLDLRKEFLLFFNFYEVYGELILDLFVKLFVIWVI